jgi:hypothetical protein
MLDNLKVVLAEFSALSLAVFVINVTVWRSQARPYPVLKNQPRFCPVSLSLSITASIGTV